MSFSLSVLPPCVLEEENVRFHVPSDVAPLLRILPWQVQLEGWEERKFKLLNVKSGLSRHVVRFVEIGERRFAIKETSFESARREYATYTYLQETGLHTLRPIGVASRNDGTEFVKTKIGDQPQERITGYLITELMEKVIPDAYLFRRGFSKSNRRRIWDAVIRLFVEMHSCGVYWGDASLANMLINFSTETVPGFGNRTILRAVLADVETVEIHRTLTDSLRLADVEFFIESMYWTEADLRASGVVREAVITKEDEQFLLDTYSERYQVEQEARWFELATKIDVDTLLGDFEVKGYARLLLKHINEHKWYLSERRSAEVPLAEAASDWYQEIFRPVCNLFKQYGFVEFFPDRTAASLYVEIMEHKYLLSEQARADVGLIVAAKDYVKRFAKEVPPRGTLRSMLAELHALLRRLPLPLQSVYQA